jgi:hypothetical protein
MCSLLPAGRHVSTALGQAGQGALDWLALVIFPSAPPTRTSGQVDSHHGALSGGSLLQQVPLDKPHCVAAACHVSTALG